MRLVPMMRVKLLVLLKLSKSVIFYKSHTLTSKHIIVLYICSKTHRGSCAEPEVEVNATLMVKDLELWLCVGRVSGSVIEREVTCSTSGCGRIMISSIVVNLFFYTLNRSSSCPSFPELPVRSFASTLAIIALHSPPIQR